MAVIPDYTRDVVCTDEEKLDASRLIAEAFEIPGAILGTKVRPAAGMIGLTHGSNLIGRAIRVGQALRFKAQYSRWNHAFIMVDDDRLIEMGSTGARLRHIADYSDTEHMLVNPLAELDLEYAWWALNHHTDYGYGIIASTALSLLTGARVEFGTKGTLICSGLVAACMVEQAPEWRADPSHVMPAEIAAKLWHFPSQIYSAPLR